MRHGLLLLGTFVSLPWWRFCTVFWLFLTCSHLFCSEHFSISFLVTDLPCDFFCSLRFYVLSELLLIFVFYYFFFRASLLPVRSLLCWITPLVVVLSLSIGCRCLLWLSDCLLSYSWPCLQASVFYRLYIIRCLKSCLCHVSGCWWLQW